ncbi:uncharacterized protein LOC124449089 [Xenia sp. Carnegie-2017]|uniref:uncharacterized protein LOC124449089 n=1 Tax=Xenia sp. Carnegie-2017 TaxID=2897299 RepID=UPI001F0354EB|nr:uncharacterized protein LOC124449089 [Xenia sp. Carnegie-2017]
MSKVTDQELDCAVSVAVSQVGPTYGRKMMKGKLEAANIKVNEKRLSRSLHRVAPDYCQQREQNTAKLLNPVPYSADYFGHKLHMDQNEKLVMYGCTTVLAVDGYSSMIMAAASMPVKNNVKIYRSVFRPIIEQYGVWDQVRVNCGKEFYLTLFVQQSLSAHRRNTLRIPYKQTPSTKNHMVERLWVEVNGRINYPIKTQLNRMAQEELIDMVNVVHQFCVSTIVIQVVQAGIQELLPAWNCHTIPGKGKPEELMNNTYRGVCVLHGTEITLPEIAVQQYERSRGQIKSFGNFGTDPLLEFQHLQIIRDKEFKSRNPSFATIFNEIVNTYTFVLYMC